MSSVVIDVLHADFPEMCWRELRFPSALSIGELKEKLQFKTGTSVEHMKLYIYAEHDESQNIALLDDSASLHGAGVRDGTTLYVVDTAAGAKALTAAVSHTPIYKMSEEEYSRRRGTAREFLANLRQKSTNATTPSATTTVDLNADSSTYPSKGQRCQLKKPGDPRGEILSFGPRKGRTGDWIIVKLDEPFGEADVPGCPDGYGCYIAGATWQKHLEVGDFPPIDLFSLDEI